MMLAFLKVIQKENPEGGTSRIKRDAADFAVGTIEDRCWFPPAPEGDTNATPDPLGADLVHLHHIVPEAR